MPRVAFFGGSFNPPHVAHQMVCLWVLETQPVDEIVVVPTFKHPFDKVLAPYADRVAMCRLMTRPFGPRARVSTIEEELGDASLTLRTLQALASREPGNSWRLVVGADILAERDKWHRWPDVQALAPPIVVGRPGYAAPEDAPPLAEVSSTDVRRRLAAGESVAALVPREVVAYVLEKGLYR